MTETTTLMKSHSLMLSLAPMTKTATLRKSPSLVANLRLPSKIKIFQPRFPEKMHPALSMNKDSLITAPINPVKI